MKTTDYQGRHEATPWPVAWMRRSGKPQGVALVATLIMLSLVTFMTVAFLGVARRERRSMEAHINQGDAQAAMEAALNMAQAELVNRLLSVDRFGTSDPWGYSLFVSTNYINPAIFSTTSSSVTNVNDHQAMFLALANNDLDIWLRQLGNLQFLPRVPVYDPAYTNGYYGVYGTGPQTTEGRFGRFFLDFNRNAMFEPTFERYSDGTLIGDMNWIGNHLAISNSLVGNYVGDPHWIGILEDPNSRHSGSNRFVARYAFVVTPAGKTIDLNHSHNQNKLGNSGRQVSYFPPNNYASRSVDGFIRNQGVGSWELNLAGLISELNTNYWVYGVHDNSSAAPAANAGAPADSFHHALGILKYRWNENFSNLTNINEMFGQFPSVRLMAGGADYVGDSVNTDVDTRLGFYPPHINLSATNPYTTWNYSWAGATNASADDTRRFHSVNDLWNSDSLLSSNFSGTMLSLSRALNDYSSVAPGLHITATRAHYTWYRMLENLETESRPRASKVNLNWDNLNSYVSGSTTNWDAEFGFPDQVYRVTNGFAPTTDSFINWSALRFFTNVAQSLIDSSITTNISTNVPSLNHNGTLGYWVYLTNYSLGALSINSNSFTVLGGETRSWNGGSGTWSPVARIIEYPQVDGTVVSNATVNRTLSLTNITVFPFNQFTPEVHRLLQVAANLYETAGNGSEWDPLVNYALNSQVRRQGRYYRNTSASIGDDPLTSGVWQADGPGLPAVFRPVFRFNTNTATEGGLLNSVYISEWVEAGDPSWLSGVTYLDLNSYSDRLILSNATVNPTAGDTPYDYMAKGFPTIIGSKASTYNSGDAPVSGGLPNFNEVSYSLMAEVTRKLQFIKTNYGAIVPHLTNQMFIVGLKAGVGLEAWNPYEYNYPRELDLFATNYMTVTIENENGPIFTNQLIQSRVWNVPANSWPTATILTNGNAFITPIGEYFSILSNAAYYPSIYSNLVTGVSTNGGFRVVNSQITPSAVFVATNLYPDIELKINFSNWVTYAAVDRFYNRVVDYVNMGDLSGEIDLIDMLLGTTNRNAGGGIFNQSTNVGSIAGQRLAAFFSTNRYSFTNGVGWGRVSPAYPNYNNFITEGISNQIRISWDPNFPFYDWREFSSSLGNIAARQVFFRNYLGIGTGPGYVGTNPVDAPFSPTIMAKMDLKFEANDPLVHYAEHQLINERSGQDTNFALLTGFEMRRISAATSPELPALIGLPGTVGRINDAFRPWGGHPLGNVNQAGRLNRLRNFNLAIKDPGIYEPRQWRFPERRFGSLGWLGRVHRGTPWQTIYMKSRVAYPTNWTAWAGASGTHPTNDWRLFDNLSVAINKTAASGALSINQTNVSAWAAVLGGVNTVSNSTFAAGDLLPTLSPWTVTPRAWQFRNIHSGIDLQRRLQRSFVRHGDILSVPELSDGSPYLNYGVLRYTPATAYARGVNVVYRGIIYYAFNPVNSIKPPDLRDHQLPRYDLNTNYVAGDYVMHNGQLWYANANIAVAESPDDPTSNWYHGWEIRRDDISEAEAYGFTDNMLEKIPQTIMSLVKLEPHPRVAVYAFGQSLAPAANSVYLFPGQYQNMVTNYQVVGETAARMVLRVEGIPEPNLLPVSPNMAPAVYPRVVVEDFKILSDQ